MMDEFSSPEFLDRVKDAKDAGATLVILLIGLGGAITVAFSFRDLFKRFLPIITKGWSPRRIAAEERREEAINDVLSAFLPMLGADRLMLCFFDGEEDSPRRNFSCKYEKKQRYLNELMPHVQNLLVKDYRECLECTVPGVVHQRLDVEDEMTASAMKSLLAYRGVQAYLCHPVMPNGKLVGFLWATYTETIADRFKPEDGDDRPRIIPENLKRCATHIEGLLLESRGKH